MAVAYRNSGAACIATAVTHNISVTGVQAGDFIIMGIVTPDTVYTDHLPKVSGLGSHQVRHMHDVTHNGYVDVFWTIATSTSHTFVVEHSVSTVCETWWAAYSGVDPANPFAGFIEASGRPQQAAQDWGPLTPDVADCMLVAMIGSDIDIGNVTFTWDSPWNERFDVTSSSPSLSATLADTLQSGGPSSQAVGGDWSHSTNASGAAFVCALRPDAGGNTGPVATAGALSALASGTALTPTLPTHATDDILFAFAANNSNQTMSCSTSGWAEVIEFTSSDFSCALYWKRAASGAETNPQIDFSAAGSSTIGHYAMCATVRGAVDTGTPYEDVTGNGTPTSNTTPASATVTATEDGSLVLHFVGIDDDNTISLSGPTSQGPPNDGQGILSTSSSSTGGDCRIAIIEEYKATAGDATGATLFTQSASDFWKVVSLVMLPAGESELIITLADPATTTFAGNTHAASSRGIIADPALVTFAGNSHAIASGRVLPDPGTTTFNGNTHAASSRGIIADPALVTFNGASHLLPEILVLGPPSPTTFAGNTHAASYVAAVAKGVATFAGKTHSLLSSLSVTSGLVSFAGKLVTLPGAVITAAGNEFLYWRRRRRVEHRR